jgi:hypothetical protein
MNCDEIKEHVYEWSKGTLPEKDRLAVEEHLQDCQGCQAYAEEVKLTLSLLNEIKLPPISAGFKERVLWQARDLPLPSKPLWERIRDWFQVPYIKWPLEGLAAAAVILIALTIYKDINPTKPSKIEMSPRSFQVELSETTAKHPIIITTRDLKETLSAIKSLIKENNGLITQTLSSEEEIQIIFGLKKENEENFLARLNKLGHVKKEKKGFRDEAGNIVVLLKLKK